MVTCWLVLVLTNIKERHNRCAASYERTAYWCQSAWPSRKYPGAVASNECLLLAKADER